MKIEKIIQVVFLLGSAFFMDHVVIMILGYLAVQHPLEPWIIEVLFRSVALLYLSTMLVGVLVIKIGSMLNINKLYMYVITPAIVVADVLIDMMFGNFELKYLMELSIVFIVLSLSLPLASKISTLKKDKESEIAH